MAGQTVRLSGSWELAENGWIVEVANARRPRYIAGDEMELAEVFEGIRSEMAEPGELAVVLPEDIPGGQRGALVPNEQRATSDEWPSTLTPGPSPTAEGEGSNEAERWPVADDGTEYPRCSQEGPNHFLIWCPTHGKQRMERDGANWRCSGKTNRQACSVAVPRSVMGRLVAASGGGA